MDSIRNMDTEIPMLLPGVIFIEGVRHHRIQWVPIGVTSLLLLLRVLLRMSGFVRHLRRQAVQLEDLATQDELTGLANRRRFEHRLIEAVDVLDEQVLGTFRSDGVGGEALADRLRNVLAARSRLGRRLGAGFQARPDGRDPPLLGTQRRGDLAGDRFKRAWIDPVRRGPLQRFPAQLEEDALVTELTVPIRH